MGKVECHNAAGDRGYFDANIIPDGWAIGALPGSRSYVSENLSNTEWYHDPETKESVRIKVGESIPSNFLRGRYEFKNAGFESINSPENIVVYDFIDRKKKVVKRTEKTKLQTTKKLNGKLILIGKYVVSSGVAEVPADVDRVLVPHYNMKGMFKNIAYKHSGKTLRELGFTVIQVKDYIHKEGDVYVELGSDSICEYRRFIEETFIS